MTSKERWQRVETLYHAALERDVETRYAFLAEVSDSDLRREVVSLLKYDDPGFIETPALELAAKEIADDTEKEPAKDLPRQIGPYNLLSLLGEGGMGEVYLALDTQLNRNVAIKLLPDEFTADSERSQRFQQEARAASALNSSNIVTVYAIGESEGQHYIVAEYIEGKTLREHIKDASPRVIKLKETIEIASSVAEALHTAHQAGIVHRDIKPENVMIRTDGMVKVLDFGLAKLANADGKLFQDGLSTQTGIVMGTVSYMSPEQARGQKVDHRADIFSLGVMLYEMLSGKKPFEGATPSDVMAAVLIREPESLEQVAPNVPSGLQRIVKRCLEKLPEKRFQSAGDLAFALQELSLPSTPKLGASIALPLRKKAREVGTTFLHYLSLLPYKQIAMAIAAILFIAAMILSVRHLSEQPQENLAASFTIGLPDNWGFNRGGAPVVSPDGKYIVYRASPISAQDEAEATIWLRRLDSAEAKPLPGTKGGVSPFWSPDSRFIAFWSKGRWQKIDVSGSSPTTICEAESAPRGSWNKDGLILLSTDPTLMQVSASGGQPAALKPFDEEETDQANPRFLPDGKHFFYLSMNKNSKNDGIYVASLDSGVKRKLILKGASVAEYVSPGYLLFARGNTLSIQPFDLDQFEVTGEPVRITEQLANYAQDYPFPTFSASENGVLAWKVGASEPDRTQLVWFDRTGKRLGVIGDTAAYSGPTFSPNEDRIAVGVVNPETKTRDLWIMQPILGTKSRFTFDPEEDMNPRWTADGKWIIFTSMHKGQRNLYRKLADGTGEIEPLLESKERLNLEDVSPDGRYLIFNFDEGNMLPDLGILSLTGEKKRTTFVATGGRDDHAVFSPDGRWVAYRSFEANKSEVLVRRFAPDSSESQAKWQISNKGGSQPQWRADGKELFYIEGNTLMAVEINISGSSITAGTPKPLFSVNLEADEKRNRYLVTKDGQRFLVVLRADTAVETTIAVQTNWQAALGNK